MADTSRNEMLHKQEKTAYRRTTRHNAAAGRQLLTVVQSRILLQDEENQLAADQRAAVGPYRRAGPSSPALNEDSEESASGDEDPTPAELSVGWGFGGAQVSADVVARRPGLSDLVHLLGVPSYSLISILTGFHFIAKHEWKALPSLSLLRSFDCYASAAWHDGIVYRHRTSTDAQFEKVLLIVAGTSVGCGEPCALVQCMDKAEPISGSTLASAGISGCAGLLMEKQHDRHWLWWHCETYSALRTSSQTCKCLRSEGL